MCRHPRDALLRPTLALLALLALCGSACAADRTAEAQPYQALQAQSLATAVAKASAWLQAHPADVGEHEVVGVVEEMMLYYALDMLAPDGPKSADYRREIASRHQALVGLNRQALSMSHDARPYLQGIWGPLTYPPAAYIVARLGMDASSYLTIVDDIVASHPYLYPPREAMQVWIWVYLDRLGHPPAPSLAAVLDRGALHTEARTHVLRSRLLDSTASQDRPATIQAIYDITHEILALTDFGAVAPSVELEADKTQNAALLDAGIRWATENDATDILAEQIFAAHLLGLDDLPAIPPAVHYILGRQQPDGAFGVTNPNRKEGRRHGVLSCLLALQSVAAAQWP